MKNFGKSSRVHSQGVQKIFMAPIYGAHYAVIFATAQLSCFMYCYSVLNVFIIAIINCCLTLISCTFQPMVALINHLLTYLQTGQTFSLSSTICHQIHLQRPSLWRTWEQMILSSSKIMQIRSCRYHATHVLHNPTPKLCVPLTRHAHHHRISTVISVLSNKQCYAITTRSVIEFTETAELHHREQIKWVCTDTGMLATHFVIIIVSKVMYTNEYMTLRILSQYWTNFLQIYSRPSYAAEQIRWNKQIQKHQNAQSQSL